MKKKSGSITTWIYIITPVVLMSIFTVVYRNHEAAQAAIRAEKQAIADAEAEKKAIEQKELEKKLQEEAERLKQVREEAAYKKELEERQTRLDEIAKLEKNLQSTVETYNTSKAQLDKYNSELEKLRAERKALDDKVWALSREVEDLRAVKSASDLESQRLVDMIVERVRRGSLSEAATSLSATTSR